MSLKKAEGVGGAARHRFAHLAAAPQVLQAGIEVRFLCFYAPKSFSCGFLLLVWKKPLCACFRSLRKRGVYLLVGEDISCVTQYNLSLLLSL